MDAQASAEVLKAAVADVKDALKAGLASPHVVDLAFIGNASPVYEWVPCRMVDLDCFIFAESLDAKVGAWLASVRTAMRRRLSGDGIAFDLRIVEGPYKPSETALDGPVIVAHLGLFTERTYLQSAPLKRWAWRKYSCERDVQRLSRLAPARPAMAEFLHGARGLNERQGAISAGRVRMTEWVLPSLEARTFEVGADDVAFQECCFAYAANCARNHARVLGHAEPDTLGNADFFPWYDRAVLHSESLVRLMALKAHCRDVGFDQETADLRRLALQYMDELQASFRHPERYLS